MILLGCSREPDVAPTAVLSKWGRELMSVKPELAFDVCWEVYQAALDGPDRASRLVLFRLYYLGGVPYDRARHFLGLSETNWVQWTEQIRKRSGQELLHCGMFAPRKYFTQARSSR
jgi:hypothetical protein